MRSYRSLIAVTACVVPLSSCASQELGASHSTDDERPVTIMVAHDSLEQRVLGEYYVLSLQSQDREAEVLVLPGEETVHGPDAHQVDVFITCTGEALHRFNPTGAKQLTKDIEADPQTSIDSVDTADLTVEKMVSALPTTLGSTDRSTATTCAESPVADELPQHLVALYDKDLLDRDEVGTLNGATKAMTSEQLEDMVEAARETGNLQAAVQESDSSGSLSTHTDSDSEDSDGALSGLK